MNLFFLTGFGIFWVLISWILQLLRRLADLVWFWILRVFLHHNVGTKTLFLFLSVDPEWRGILLIRVSSRTSYPSPVTIFDWSFFVFLPILMTTMMVNWKIMKRFGIVTLCSSLSPPSFATSAFFDIITVIMDPTTTITTLVLIVMFVVLWIWASYAV